MEWLWVALLCLIIFGPVVLLFVRRRRGEKLPR